MTTVVWISGASSGIGAQLARDVPYPDARVIGIARRAPVTGEHLCADLSRPAGWAAVNASFREVLGSGATEKAAFLHFSGVNLPAGTAATADWQQYSRAVLLNGAAGQITGQAFLSACREHHVPPVLVICSSPAALEPVHGISHYGAGKAALLFWTAIVRQEEPGSVVLAVIPWATDTPMLRSVVSLPAGVDPIADELREDLARGQVATPEQVSREIWSAVLAGAPESPLHVGRVASGTPPGSADAVPGDGH